MLYRHRGHLYREALTPEQKQLKKDWLLEQQKQEAKGVPTWEQVRDMIEKTYSDEHTYRVEWAADSPRLGSKLDEVLRTIFGKDLVDEAEIAAGNNPEDMVFWILEGVGVAGVKAAVDTALADTPFSYNYSNYDDPDLLLDFFLELAAEAVVMDQYHERYDAVARDLKTNLNGQTCYRLISTPEGVAPYDLDGVGEFWSLDPEKVGLYVYDETEAELRPMVWRLSARVDVDGVDLWETIMHYMNPDYGEKEDEIRWFKHAPIYIYTAEVINDYYRDNGPALGDSNYDVGLVYSINAWKRT